MTTLLEGARSFATRGTDLGTRIDGLEQAARAAQGRLDDGLVAEATGLAERAAGRVRLSARHTVVAIAGATGSGKSTTFNALTGLELSSTGVRRPTTSWATACVWGGEGAEELLEWLGIPPRHQTMRDSMLDTGRDDHLLDGVVLLDLPDHDSTEVSHHLEVDRLVQLADLLVWVLDPQKYADAAVHDRYFAPLHEHAGVMLVVLNHIDTVPAERRESMLADVRRLLAADGLAEVEVLAVSSREGLGVDELRHQIAERVEAKRSTRERLTTDLHVMAGRLAEAGGEGRPRELEPRRVRDLEAALAEAAGVPTVVGAVERVASRRLRGAVGWPPASWASSILRGEPDLVVDLDRGRSTSPDAVAVQRSRVDTELRTAADDAAAGLTRPWVDAARTAALARRAEVGDGLDAALAGTDLRADRLPLWARGVQALHLVLLLAFFGGAAWTAVLLAQGRLDAASTPDVAGQPVPLVLAVAGFVLGLVLAVALRPTASRTAAARARATEEQLREQVHRLTESSVAEPLRAELDRYTRFRAGIAAARR